MSNRPITEDDLHAYVDQLLEPERRGEVTAYLDAHSDVARRVAGFSDQRALLRNALAPIAHEPLPPELNLSRIIEGRRRRLSPWRAVAAVLLIGIGGIGGWIARGAMPVSSNGLATNGLATNGLATNGLAALEQEAADSFKVYAPDRIRPVEVRASEGTQLERWLSNRL